MATRKPFYVQSLLSTSLLLALLVVTFPLSLAISLTTLVFKSRRIEAHRQETILVTGARTQKSLTMARMFWRAGYRVVMADEREWSLLCASRFSRCVSAFYTLPDPVAHHEAYAHSIRSIIEKENVRLWVPGSSAGATVNDARVAEEVRRKDGVDVFIQSAREIEQLHNKDLFGGLVKELGLKVPESILVDDQTEAVEFLHSNERQGRKYILKCTALDDQGRSDLTRLPFATRVETRAHFAKMPRRISKQTPYVLQQFIDGYEFCTHCHAVDGEMRSFLSCPSSDMLMRYVDCRTAYSDSINDKAEEWTRAFLKKWKAKLDEQGDQYNLTGHFSFDFIVDSANGELYPIECNPRIHTAVVLLSTRNSSTMASSYTAKKGSSLIKPDANARAYSWMLHSLPLAFARSVLPKQLQARLHPWLPISKHGQDAPVLSVTLSPNKGFVGTVLDYATGRESDPMLDMDDPLPFAAQHVMWIWLLARLVFVQRKGWSRLNVSTSRIFTC